MSNKPAGILILVPGQEARGGVTTYFNSLRKHFGSEVIFLERGSRSFPYRKGLTHDIVRLLKDYRSFFNLLKKEKTIQLVHINTSLDKRGIGRDTIYIMLARLLRKKVVLFYHGWDTGYAQQVLCKPSAARKLLFRADAAIVLSEGFKKELVVNGYTNEVFVETTSVDTDLLEGLDAAYLQHKTKAMVDGRINLLFLARIEEEKGVFIALEAFKKIKESVKDIDLIIVGDGQALNKLKEQVKQEALENVHVEGFIRGNKRADYFERSHIYILPTVYKEGMPTSVLEAFAFGLPVVTRPVAGIMDVMVEGVNGHLIPSTDADAFAECIINLLKDQETYNRIASGNFKYAARFYSDNVCERISRIYRNVSGNE